MADPKERIDELRWRAMKVLRAEGKSFAEMVPILQDRGLLSCQDHDTSKRRVNKAGEITCPTCENTVNQQWGRNLARLSEDEADIMEVKWAWLEAHEFIARTCRERHIQKVNVRTIRRTWIEPTEGETWNVTVQTADGPRPATVTSSEIVGAAKVVTETVREETRIYPEMLKLLSETRDKINKARGIDMEADEGAGENVSGESAAGSLTVERADGANTEWPTN